MAGIALSVEITKLNACTHSLTAREVVWHSLAGQPLLTQKARKGLVNGVAPAYLNGMHITSSNMMSLNYAYWVYDCAQYVSEYRAAVTNASLRLGYRRYQSTLTRRFAWKIGNDIHYVVCGCIASQHMGYMRPLQAILYVADHKI